MSRVLPDPNFWANKRVFITGHTGFKGGWLSLWLQSLGACIRGFALKPLTEPNLFCMAQVANGMESVIGDILDFERLRNTMIEFNPDIVIHMAAQPLVRASYKDPVGTYHVNVLGTVHVLEAARQCENLRVIVNVTSDKCYENKEWVWGYREEDPMGGFDPYSSSKGCAELVTSAYRRSFLLDAGIGVATVRAGNVIGGGDWSEDRLVPDILRSFEKGDPAIIRNPKAIRPWQHVLEPLCGYLVLTEKLWSDPEQFSEGWNFGPNDTDIVPVSVIATQIAELWADGACWVLDESSHPHEAVNLKLDVSKARAKLGWGPVWSLGEALRRIVNWHRAWHRGMDMKELCLREITEYMEAGRENG